MINDLMLQTSCGNGGRGGQSARLVLIELLDSGSSPDDFFFL